MPFPATQYVASLAMVRSSNPASPCGDPGLGTKWRMERPRCGVSRGGHLSATCRRRSRSRGCAVATRISRLPMRFRVRSTSRCSRWSASASLRRRALTPRLIAKGADVVGRECRRCKQSKFAGATGDKTRRVLPRRASCLRNRPSRSAASVHYREVADLKVGTTLCAVEWRLTYLCSRGNFPAHSQHRSNRSE